MKKIIIIILFIISNNYFFYAQPSIQWQKSLGGSDYEIAYSIQQTTDGGFITAGYSVSNDGDVTGNHGNDDYWVVKLDNSGNIQWEKSYGGSNQDAAYSISQTSDGGYIVAGSSNSIDGDVTGLNGDFDYWIIKLDSSGTLQWQKSLGGSEYDVATSILQTFDGGYIVGGYSYSEDSDVTENYGNDDYWLVKLDSTGDIQWQNSLGGSDFDFSSSILQTTDSGYIISGASNSNDTDVTGNHGNEDFWIVKLNDSGNIQWQKSYGGTDDDAPYSISQTSDGGYIAAGTSYSDDGDVSGHHGSGNEDCWVIKIDSSGNLQWQKSFGGTFPDGVNSIIQTIDGGYSFAGYTGSSDGDVTVNHGFYDFWIVKLDTSGSIQWQKTFGGTDDDYANSFQQTSDGGFIIAGNSYSTDGDITGHHGTSSYYDFWIVKLSPALNVNEIQNAINNFNIAPNPFSENTIISFNLSSADKVEIKICDLEGRVIKNLSSVNLNSGLNEINWSGTDNAGDHVCDGIYFARINSDNFSECRMVEVLSK